MQATTADLALRLPAFDGAQTVVAGPGNWSGAPRAIWNAGYVWLAYRVRRPLDSGRGVSVVLARSLDGLDFEPVTEVFREAFAAASFERPVIIAKPEGGWRLYLSCATPDSKHWWIEALDADRPGELCLDDIAVLEDVVGESLDDWRSDAGRDSFKARTT